MTSTVDEIELRDTRSLFHSLALNLRNRALTAGDVAGLRRMSPERLDAPGFWKLAGLCLDEHLPGDARARARAETAWGAVVVGLAVLGDLQRDGERLGRALAHAGYSELRFVRLLRADAEWLVDEIPQVARFLAAKQQPAGFVDAALLVLGSDAVREATRRHLARDYYSSLNE
ncbi:MAG: type I-E CRISPR-associated protein Cse2/CasB [Planctomycetes bacterium]|nr:type I-E CRISPR-associated protein Cse2/CasB [Planctomycetota bacterium]